MAEVTVPGAVSAGSIGISAKQVIDASVSSVLWSIPARIGTLTVQVKVVTAGTYRVEITASPMADVSAETADWFDVFGADQSGDRQQAVFAAITAVRITRVGGSMRCCIRGQ